MLELGPSTSLTGSIRHGANENYRKDLGRREAWAISTAGHLGNPAGADAQTFGSDRGS
jgi:hypothetical protein